MEKRHNAYKHIQVIEKRKNMGIIVDDRKKYIIINVAM